MKPATLATLNLLRAHPEGVTHLDALYAIGTSRLAARVWELRNLHGIAVESEDVVVDGARFARYRLAPKTEQLRAFG